MMYSIGKVASESNLTVRTLRYYDEIDLLKPSHVAKSGYRWYSKKDVLKLQRIIALKELGFDLRQIKEILDQNKWKHVFEEHLAFIAKEKQRLDYLEKLTRLCLQLSMIEQNLSWDAVFRYVRQSQAEQHDKIQFYSAHFEDKELDILNNPRLNIGEKDASTLVELLKTANEQKNEDPSSPASQQLAERFAVFLKDAFQGDEALIDKYWSLQKQASEEPFLLNLDKETMRYIDAIMDIYEEQKRSKKRSNHRRKR